MKEQLRTIELTTSLKTPYAGNMNENGADQDKIESLAPAPARGEQQNAASPRGSGILESRGTPSDTTAQALKAWERHLSGERVGPETRMSIVAAASMGIFPPGNTPKESQSVSVPDIDLSRLSVEDRAFYELTMAEMRKRQEGPGGKIRAQQRPPGGLTPIDPSRFNPGIANQRFLNDLAREMANAQRSGDLDHDRLTEAISELRSARREGSVDITLANELNDTLQAYRKIEKQRLQEQREQDRLESGRYVQYLGAPERQRLESGDPDEILKWLDTSFDRLYRLPVQGALAESPEFQEFSNAYREARRLVKDSSESRRQTRAGQNRMSQEDTDRVLDELNLRFYTTYHNMVMRAQMTLASKVEQVLNYAGTMKAHFLLKGFAMEDGRVGAAYQLIDDYVETERLLSPQQHVTPETIAQVTGEDPNAPFVTGQIELALAGFGPFAEIAAKLPPQGSTREEQVQLAVIRAVRTGYNLWVNTQRQAVVVSRGRKLEDGTFLSDPIGPFALYNPEQFFQEKWTNRTADEVKLKEETKLKMADDYLKTHPHLRLSDPERIELGERLFKEFINIPDFFSSGWRMDKIFEAIQDRCDAIWNPDVEYAYDAKKGTRFIVRDFPNDPQRQIRAKYAEARAKEMALFLRLKNAGDGRKYLGGRRPDMREKNEELREVWGKIFDYHPEEVARLFQERVADDVSAIYSVNDLGHKKDDLNDPNVRFPYSPRTRALYARYRELFNNPVFAGNGIRHYKDFKKMEVIVNGRSVPLTNVLSAIRQEGYSIMQQVNFANPEQWVQLELNSMLGPTMAQRVKDMYAAFGRFGAASMEDLISNDKFEDIYVSKVLKTDDALLSELENGGFSKKAKEGIKWMRDGERMVNGRLVNYRIAAPRIHGVIQAAASNGRAENATFMPLAKRYSSEGRGDAYVRCLGDTKSAEQAIMTHLLNFFKVEGYENKAKEARAMTEQVIGYNGVDNAVEAVRQILGTYLDLGKLDGFAEVLGLSGFPFRSAASKLQKLLGPHAEALSQDERRVALDHVKNLLIKAGSTLAEDEKKLSPEEQARILKKRRHEAEDAWFVIEKEARVRGRDVAKRRSMSLILFLMLMLGAEAWNLIDIDSMLGKKK